MMRTNKKQCFLFWLLVPLFFFSCGKKQAKPRPFPAPTLKKEKITAELKAIDRYAKDHQIKVSKEELDNTFQKEKKRFASEEVFQKELHKAGLTEEAAKEQIRLALLVKKIKKSITVTPSEIAKAQATKEGKNKSKKEIIEELKMGKLAAKLSAYFSPH